MRYFSDKCFQDYVSVRQQCRIESGEAGDWTLEAILSNWRAVFRDEEVKGVENTVVREWRDDYRRGLL